ncbi:transposase [Gemmata sp. G18]|uniref:Transposase n=1 Tax=Gemmata palustris TaxID=2822762 RepID=A0ABS5BTX3_9BACT|nr:transposase [Gemmata palustris]MBP3957101.1 transposase [Gemmata palustris]
MSAIAYFITFSTYGTWLHGDERGSVDRNNNAAGEVLLPENADLLRTRKALMNAPEYRMKAPERETVLTAIRQHAEIRDWRLLAVHVRTNHVHLVVVGDAKPERMMTEFKAYASRALNRNSPAGAQRKYWTRHGSTRWLNTDESVLRAIEYTVSEQGEPMAVYHVKVEGTNEPRLTS